MNWIKKLLRIRELLTELSKELQATQAAAAAADKDPAVQKVVADLTSIHSDVEKLAGALGSVQRAEMSDQRCTFCGDPIPITRIKRFPHKTMKYCSQDCRLLAEPGRSKRGA